MLTGGVTQQRARLSWRTVRRRRIFGLGAVAEVGTQRLPSFMNTNREEMQSPPGLVITYDRELVVQSWLIDGSSVTDPPRFGAYP